MEVILDVVYNHTAEGNHMGPTRRLRGIDNASYYRLVEGDQQHYFDTTGTGNSLLMRSPHALQLITDSLRYWVTEMHVDGFRFDLAATLARQFRRSTSCPRSSTSWSRTRSSRASSSSPNRGIWAPAAIRWAASRPAGPEWNGRYRDTVRDFWRSQPHVARIRLALDGQLRPNIRSTAADRWRP